MDDDIWRLAMRYRYLTDKDMRRMKYLSIRGEGITIKGDKLLEKKGLVKVHKGITTITKRGMLRSWERI